MLHRSRALVGALLAAAAVGGATAGAASAASTIDVTGPSVTTAASSRVIMTYTAIGTSNGTISLDIALTAGEQSCEPTGVHSLQIGTISSGSLSADSLFGARLTPNFSTPWTLSVRCVNGEIVLDGAGGPQVTIDGFNALVYISPATRPIYTGSITFALSLAGTTLTINGSAVRATPGGSSASFSGALAASPAIAYTLS